MAAIVMQLLVVGVLVALVQGMRTRSLSKRWQIIGILLLSIQSIVSMPAVGYFLLNSLERPFAPLHDFPADCRIIVVLAGSALPTVHREPVEKLGDSSLRRCLEAFRLYKQSGRSTLIVSGGHASNNSHAEALANIMASLLVELGVKSEDIQQESESTTTLENCVAICRLLEAHGTDRIVLVTDAAHMQRAVKCFERRGIHVTPAPCNYQAAWVPDSWRWFVPSAGGLLKTQYACHEILGSIWYWFIDSAQV